MHLKKTIADGKSKETETALAKVLNAPIRAFFHYNNFMF